MQPSPPLIPPEESPKPPDETPLPFDISEMQLDVIDLAIIAEICGNKENDIYIPVKLIANRLGFKEKRIRNRLTEIYNKAGFSKLDNEFKRYALNELYWKRIKPALSEKDYEKIYEEVFNKAIAKTQGRLYQNYAIVIKRLIYTSFILSALILFMLFGLLANHIFHISVILIILVIVIFIIIIDTRDLYLMHKYYEKKS
jgi:hypothetical protein